MYRRILIAFFTICSILLLLGSLPIHGEAEVYESVVRLHVLANSDSEEDQALKLKVRDALLEKTAPLLASCSSQEEACARLLEHQGELQRIAEEVIRAEGYDYPVTILLGEEDYPEKNYDGVCFPSGKYTSLRVCIGNAEGQNWWCCLFPPLCLGNSTVSSQDAEDAFLAVGLTPDQYKIITQTDKPIYRVRFKILEIFQSWR